ncbi:hypothetical protein H5410_060005 [Solanum commersonii]|uniref:Uncharacterized protein n=1 Tax=Solanum commersonii TaxID=4109 RepID=A0A9J5W4C4_SOLCO|nr:hypothetical protein H5410_060005 [Solanum commersonii]
MGNGMKKESIVSEEPETNKAHFYCGKDKNHEEAIIGVNGLGRHRRSIDTSIIDKVDERR